MKSWIPEAIIYQVNFRSLAHREPRNAIEAALEEPLEESPVAYLTRNLDVMKDLGPTVLHIMPPFVMGKKERKGIGSPYAIQDYMNIDPEYGTMEEFTELVRSAREKGFKVIIGMVPNHTSPDNVWTQTDPDYYVRDDEGHIAYDLDWSDTGKLNYKAEGLRKGMAAVYDHWLGFLGSGEGVDGFRIDMAHFINDKSFWNETLPKLKEKYAHREILFMAECYGRDNNLDLFERGFNGAYDDDFYKGLQWFFGTDHKGSSMLLPSRELNGEWLRPLKEIFESDGIAGVFENTLVPYELALKNADDAPRLARYTDNHDEGRGVYRFGAGAVQAAMRLSFFGPHAMPFMLTGQEFGAENRPPIHERFQICDKGRRVPDGEGYRDVGGIEFEGNSFARGIDARRAWYAFYRELIALRLEHKALTRGSFNLLCDVEAAKGHERSVVAFERSLDGTTLKCAVNFSGKARPLAKTMDWQGEALYGSLSDGALGPWSGIVIKS